jgi:hypothetical protein
MLKRQVMRGTAKETIPHGIRSKQDFALEDVIGSHAWCFEATFSSISNVRQSSWLVE